MRHETIFGRRGGAASGALMDQCGQSLSRFRPDEEDDVDHLVRKQGGGFAFRYDIRGDQEEESGYHFSSDRFILGDYVSVREEDGLHTFQVASVEPL